MVPVLHGYWRSGTSYRTRIGLELKGLAYEQAPVDLRTGAQRSEAFLRLNPQGLAPALEIDGLVLTQSMAILEYLDEAYPEPPLLPPGAAARAQVRAMADVVACGIPPLNNLRLLKAIKELGVQDQAGQNAWAGRWINAGFEALERLIGQHGSGWCWGEAPTIADCCLIPQVYSARRFEVDLEPYPLIRAIDLRAAAHPAFQAAHPDRQPDADQ